jgi:hypothetical protein
LINKDLTLQNLHDIHKYTNFRQRNENRFKALSQCFDMLIGRFQPAFKETELATVPPLPKSFEDAARHQLAVTEELERVCGSAHFRTSKRSCEFLQFIVRVTLDGRTDSLKERSIGIDLFGRDATYEPSSDATVRVRANEVRKRLTSYYSSTVASSEARKLEIHLPTGSYVPRFVPVEANTISGSGSDAQTQIPVTGPSSVTIFSLDRLASSVPAVSVISEPVPSVPSIPSIQVLTLMRPALLALLMCTLLLRHQLENREEYLRFWDRLLSGRTALVLSVSPQDRVSLASSLYPLVWVAGRYGVDAAMQGDSLTGAKPEAATSVQVSFDSPSEMAADRRLRWVFAPPPGLEATVAAPKPLSKLLDRHPPTSQSPSALHVSSAAMMTVLPETASTLHVQGTDADAIRHLLEELTVERNFPSGLVEKIEHLDSRHALQVLLYRDATGDWRRDFFLGDA